MSWLAFLLLGWCHAQTSRGGKGSSYSAHSHPSQSIMREVRAGAQAEAMEEHCYGLLSLLSSSTQEPTAQRWDHSHESLIQTV